MTARSPEFLIKGVVEGVSGRLTVIGRCGDEPIGVYDSFEVVFRNKKRPFPDESGQDPVRAEQRPVKLRVECIHAYERSLEQLGQGMVGSLVLQGEGGNLIAPGWFLGMHAH